jgi:hypothetical protein
MRRRSVIRDAEKNVRGVFGRKAQRYKKRLENEQPNAAIQKVFTGHG